VATPLRFPTPLPPPLVLVLRWSVGRRQATRDSVAVAYNTRNTRNTVGKGTVWLGYGHPKPVPVPEHTRDHIITVLAVPVSCLSQDCERSRRMALGRYGTQADRCFSRNRRGTKLLTVCTIMNSCLCYDSREQENKSRVKDR